MKTKSLFVMGLAALAFSACTNDDGVPGSGSNVLGGGGENVEPTWVTLKLAVENTPKSRAFSSSGTANTTDATETSTVKDAVILIFNATTKVLENKVEFTGSDEQKNILSTPGAKRIYSLANINSVSSIKTQIDALVEKTSVLDDYLALKYTAPTAGLAEIATTGSYVLTSSDAHSSVTFKAGVVENTTVAGADGNNFTIAVDYMAAKVGVKLASSTTNQIGTIGQLDGLTFVIRNIAKKCYVAQKSPIQGAFYDWTPAHPTDATEWDANFWSPGLITDATNPVNLTDSPKYFLATENVNKDAVIGNTTYAAIRGQFVPAAGTVVTSATWNVLTNRVELVKGDLPTGTTTFHVSNIGNLADVPVGTIFSDLTVMNKACSMAAQGTATPTLLSGNDWLEDTHYMTYSSGYCWYRMNIGSGSGKDTEFHVKRGHIYTATINNITGLGASKPAYLNGTMGDGASPDLPLTQSTYVNATITVTPWVDVPQDGDL